MAMSRLRICRQMHKRELELVTIEGPFHVPPLAAPLTEMDVIHKNRKQTPPPDLTAVTVRELVFYA
jgi:hypothetical protein